MLFVNLIQQGATKDISISKLPSTNQCARTYQPTNQLPLYRNRKPIQLITFNEISALRAQSPTPITDVLPRHSSSPFYHHDRDADRRNEIASPCPRVSHSAVVQICFDSYHGVHRDSFPFLTHVVPSLPCYYRYYCYYCWNYYYCFCCFPICFSHSSRPLYHAPVHSLSLSNLVGPRDAVHHFGNADSFVP